MSNQGLKAGSYWCYGRNDLYFLIAALSFNKAFIITFRSWAWFASFFHRVYEDDIWLQIYVYPNMPSADNDLVFGAAFAVHAPAWFHLHWSSQHTTCLILSPDNPEHYPQNFKWDQLSLPFAQLFSFCSDQARILTDGYVTHLTMAARIIDLKRYDDLSIFTQYKIITRNSSVFCRLTIVVRNDVFADFMGCLSFTKSYQMHITYETNRYRFCLQVLVSLSLRR